MSFSIGIVGLPNVGKSTLFQALTKKQVDAQNYPFCTIDPNVGVVKVPDNRLDRLAEALQATQKIPTAIEFVDIAGLVKGASQGEGLGNKFLANIREVDAICQVARDFENKDVVHVNNNKIDPTDDTRTINLELILADMETVGKRIAKLKKQSRGDCDKKIAKLLSACEKIEQILKDEKLAIETDLDVDEKELIKELNLLTIKPMLYVRNINEESGANSELNNKKNIIDINIKLESDLSELSANEENEYRQEMGAGESGLDKLILSSYKLLDLITFYTASFKNINQAWTIKCGSRAPQAAGTIHNDFEQGFIRAEIINWQDLIDCKSETVAREKGLIHAEGKEYIMQDGDVCHFLFNK
ncbi:MAG: redox-regulated ATPase YchF [Patescibacteria group bacterium]|nr:redox-regulated ATPase YchF [Patescibacteria group bacterium]